MMHFFVFLSHKINIICRDIPTIIHGLNLVPTQGELRDLVAEVSIKFE